MALVLWAIAGYLLVFVASLLVFVGLIVSLPARYFVEKPNWFLTNQPPWKRWLLIIGKNLAGLILICVGVLLALPGIPGQGLVTIAVGVILLDIPGKRRAVRWLAHRRKLVRQLNRLRSWFGRPPLIVESDE